MGRISSGPWRVRALADYLRALQQSGNLIGCGSSVKKLPGLPTFYTCTEKKPSKALGSLFDW